MLFVVVVVAVVVVAVVVVMMVAHRASLARLKSSSTVAIVLAVVACQAPGTATFEPEVAICADPGLRQERPFDTVVIPRWRTTAR